jgi:hypothetical protein
VQVAKAATHAGPELPEGQVSVETRKRVRHVSRIRKRYRDNKRAAYTELESEYGDSYFFYFFFSGLQASGAT